MDESLLKRVATGDAGAMRACIDRYGGLVWSLARRQLPTEADTEDAVQEIFVDVWRSAGRFDERVASETTFVAMIARRRLIDRRRRLGREPGLGWAFEGVRAFQGEGAPARFEVDEEAGRAAAAMDRLSPDQQRVLRLSILHGLSHERISDATGMPLGTVKTHVRRGLIRVREMLGVAGREPMGG